MSKTLLLLAAWLMISMIEINRYIKFYEKNGNKYIGKILLKNVTLKDLQSLV